MTRSRVAVLLACYNGASFIDEQLASIAWQRDVDVEIFVRDDGSSDQTLAIVGRFGSEVGDKVRLMTDARGRQGSAALNFFQMISALDAEPFDYIAFADQDDIWAPRKLADAVAMMQETASEGYSSNLIAYDPRAGRSWILDKGGPQKQLDYLFQGASAGCTYVLSAAALVMVKTVLAGISAPWPKGVSHDWSSYAICRSRGLKWVIDPSAPITYRQHFGNLYGARSGLRGLIGKMRMAQQGWYVDHIRWLRHIVIGTSDETEVFRALESPGIRARFWLVGKAATFRRKARHVALLRMVILCGLLSPGSRPPVK